MNRLLIDAFVSLARLILSHGQDPKAILDAELDASDAAAIAAINELPDA